MTTPIRLAARARQLGTIALVAVIAAPALKAQQGPPKPPLSNEARFDSRFSHSNVMELGWSLIIPTGVYMRSTLTAAGGYAWREKRWTRESRYEATSRFLFDPFRESRVGVSVGGGMGFTNSDGFLGEPNIYGVRKVRWRPYLAMLVDVEMRKKAGLTPAIQLGLGGGLRAGVLVRTSTNRWR